MTCQLSRRQLLAALPIAMAAPALRASAAEVAARVTLLHVNDFHSRHEGAQPSAAACRVGVPCTGGSARLVAAIRDSWAEAALADGRAVIALDGGDQALGSLYYTLHKGMAEAAIQRLWGVRAMVPGNHDFHQGPGGLAGYIRALGVPMLAANMDTSREPLLDGLITPYAIFADEHARIGVIGVTLESIPQVSSPGPNLRFTDATEAVAREVAHLRAGGRTTIVLLSHRGLDADRAIAAEVPGIDVIVGGHSHTLLASLPGAAGPHPVVVEGKDRPVRIVQAGAFGRYFGRLDLDLAADGTVAAHGGMVKEITEVTPMDGQAAAVVARFGAPLQGLLARHLAEAAGEFGVADCRSGECAIGNLLADAMLAATPTADLALTNGGGIRAGLPAGPLTLGDVLNTLPFSNTLATARLRGHHLLEALENGLSQPGSGRFPQLAGAVIEWNPAAPAGQRLVSARITTARRPGPVEPEADYVIATNNFLRTGGDGYAVLRDHALEAYDSGPPLEDVLSERLAASGRVAPRMEGRIVERR